MDSKKIIEAVQKCRDKISQNIDTQKIKASGRTGLQLNILAFRSLIEHQVDEASRIFGREFLIYRQFIKINGSPDLEHEEGKSPIVPDGLPDIAGYNPVRTTVGKGSRRDNVISQTSRGIPYLVEAGIT